MPNLKNRLVDEVKRQINRRLRLEICVVTHVDHHETPNDRKFNTVDVLIRDRASATDEYRFRRKIIVPPNYLGGNCMGATRSPRIGDVVLVMFYADREAVLLGPAWSWAEYPVCRPSPYDIADKGGQWMEPYQHPVTGDFTRQPYPEVKKPYCFRWWHGPVKGDTGPGRDWCFLFDFCQLGNAVPNCSLCKTIDSISRFKNHYLKFYSEETESRKAYPYRAEFHAHCGSYWMFESKDRPSSEYVSEIYTEGEGYWTVQGAKIENNLETLLGHIRHSPDGSMEGHSATPETFQEDNVGHRWKVYSPDSTISDSRGPIAAELVNLEKKALVRIYKDGSARMVSANDVTGATGRSEVVVGVDGHCWLWNLVDDARIEFFSGGVATVTSPVEINLNAPVIKQNGMQIHPSIFDGWVSR